MKKLEADIKNGIRKRVYLLYGPQSYLRNIYRDRLIKVMLPEGDTINFSKFEGKDIDVNEVIDLARTMPFFADKRVILLENTGLFAAACDELAEFMQDIPDSTCLIFSEEKTDARLKLFKAVKQQGCVAEFKNPDAEQIRNFILNRLGKDHRRITGKALDLLMEKCGTDLMQISNELEKLVSYTFKKDGIYPDDVEAVCVSLPEDKVFLMLDEVFKGNVDGAMMYYKDLVVLQHDAIGILALIESQLRLLLHIKQLDEGHLSTKEMADELAMNEYRIKKALPQARRSSKIRIMNGLNLCLDVDEATKSGRINKQIGLETVILRLCQNQ